MYDHFNNGLSQEERDRREANRQKRLNILRERSEEEQLKEAVKQEEERLRKEREEKNTPKEIKLTNPRWVHVDDTARSERPDSAYIGETIKLIVDQQDGDGKPITFDVRDRKISTKMDPDQEVKILKSKIESPSPEVEWVINDPRSKKDYDREMQVLFFTSSGQYYSDNCEVQVLEKPDIGYLFSF